MSCTAGVNVGEANKVLTSFNIRWPSGFTYTCGSKEQMSINIVAYDQNGEPFTWSGLVSIIPINEAVSTNVPEVEIINGSATVNIYFSHDSTEIVETKLKLSNGEIITTLDTLLKIYPNVKNISLDQSNISIEEHGLIKLIANLTPADAWNKNVFWSSDNVNIATVDESGLVTAIFPGYVNITATTEDRGLTATCAVTVVFNPAVLYVSTSNGNDNSPGTLNSPKATIQNAIDTAYNHIQNGLADSFAVHVAQGTYEQNYYEGNYISVKEGISLYGGYSNDFSARDPSVYETKIIDMSQGDLEGLTNEPITVYDGVTEQTVIDGFTISGSNNSTYTIGIDIINASPTIQNNIINGGAGSVIAAGIGISQNASPVIQYNVINGGNGIGDNRGISMWSYCNPKIEYNTITGATGNGNGTGIRVVTYCIPKIKYNTIDGGSGDGSEGVSVRNNSSVTLIGNYIYGGNTASENNTTRAIMVENNSIVKATANKIHAGRGYDTWGLVSEVQSSLRLKNNIIFGGNATHFSCAIAIDDGGGEIRNNTIDGGTAPGIFVIEMSNIARPDIQNNIIFTSGASSWGTLIIEVSDNGGTQGIAVGNNCLWARNGEVLYEDYNGVQYTDITSLNDLGYVSGNISIDPLFADIDGTDDDITTIEDNDWHLIASSPVNIRQGGLDGSAEGWGYDTDMEEAPRTNLSQGPNGNPTNTGAAGWSMGAFEKD